MTPLSIAVLSVSMSADAFAAAIGRGASERPSLPSALKAGMIFGVIEALTPLLGWAFGLAASSFVAQIDHWIAFGLLGAVGSKMVWEGSRRKAAEATRRNGGAMALVATAVGTSVDAAAVGVSLALLGAPIVAIALSIGFTTFALASLGMVIGRAAGLRLGATVELLGGLALIVLGTKILGEHLGYIG